MRKENLEHKDREIHGNSSGIRQSVLEEMRGLYELSGDRKQFLSQELCDALCAYTEMLNREIAVYIARDGSVQEVSIGDVSSAALSEMRRKRSESRLSGVRLVHTHPGGNPHLSQVDLGTLRSGRMDAMASIGVESGQSTGVQVGFYIPQSEDDGEGEKILLMGPLSLDTLNRSEWQEIVRTGDLALLRAGRLMPAVDDASEKAILVGLDDGRGEFDDLTELEELAKTAGAEVLAKEVQRRASGDNAYYLGVGKLQELSQGVMALGANLIVADDELTAVQIRNMEENTHCRVIDRTALILDIFADRARSREGKLQVELAQQKYRLPRLLGAGQAMSRLGAGIGTRGPGEKKLETDRRRIRRRIFELEQEIDGLSKQRDLRRTQRRKNAVPVVALVGYTNAGKSTLLNSLSGSEVLAADMLFATLDPVTRSLELPEGTQILLSDTVGFIRKLPHQLVQAFRSTLEEVRYADLILHVIDAANPKVDQQILVVKDVLAELKVEETPILNVYNKIDHLKEEERQAWGLRSGYAISAKEGTGLQALLRDVEQELTRKDRDATITIPYNRGDLEAMLRRNGTILEEEFAEEGWLLRVRAPHSVWGAVEKALSQEK